MKLIAITPEVIIEHEEQMIIQLLSSGIDYVHLRHPLTSDEDMVNLLHQIPQEFHNGITLASHQHLFREFPNIGGVHFNSKTRLHMSDVGGLRKSKSYHKNDSFLDLHFYDYAFLSPIFNSISKQDYSAAFTTDELVKLLRNIDKSKIVALGGLNNENISQVQKLGFGGAAFLGYLFNDKCGASISNKVNKLILYK